SKASIEANVEDHTSNDVSMKGKSECQSAEDRVDEVANSWRPRSDDDAEATGDSIQTYKTKDEDGGVSPSLNTTMTETADQRPPERPLQGQPELPPDSPARPSDAILEAIKQADQVAAVDQAKHRRHRILLEHHRGHAWAVARVEEYKQRRQARLVAQQV